ncbi:pyridoxamine 5'-phosphate oxidase [Acrocarpospora phusangensis]|uniref:Pyridoxamine 5'-phosphate oxidase n=1 Tax=Acrocarpospora phusangensis TaxID=1070424 RepID=A0A919Q8K5_9ACTN|nr:pyridoxal 5'-phosphate synthase [Acrocarpospora phusangensis]GIH22680.1 pyridoxamine 5'-phosphate oxidase [Acrocarpospora phusangensis]
MVAGRGSETGSIRDLLRGLPVFADELPVFDVDSAPASPVALFVDWLKAAIEAGVPEPHAMTLSTADAAGRPSSRVLICKDIDVDGCWYFAANRASRKGRELAVNGHAALNFYWPRQGRQIRVSGPVQPTGPERSAADFLARSPGSRAEALAGRQSEILTDPGELATAVEEAQNKIAATPDLVAQDWTLYAVRANEVEFWQANRERCHIRLQYVRDDSSWIHRRLWP